MKESFEESAMLPVVSLFTLFFIGFLCLMINYYKCFKMKNEVINIIEKYNGYTTNADNIIKSYLQASHYTGNGNCPTGYNDKSITSNTKICVRQNDVDNSFLKNYSIKLFYSLNFLGSDNNFITFDVGGTTIDLTVDESQIIRELTN